MAQPFYHRAGITLHLGDCRDVLPELAPASIDLLVTDPPYGVSWQSNSRAERFDPIAGDDDAAWVPDALALAGRPLRQNRHAYIFGRFPLTFPFAVSSELVWDKRTMSGGDLTSPWGTAHEPITFAYRAQDRSQRSQGRGKLPARLRSGTVLSCPRPYATRHPTEKPVPLLRRLIESSSRFGETVLDPFAGVGSTLVAAVAEGRRAVGIELDERYATIAAKRIDLALAAYENLDLALAA